MSELEDLRAAVAKAILNADDIDKPYLAIGGRGRWTRRELARDIELKTDVGNSIVKDIVLLATDLVLREKRQLTTYDRDGY